MNKATFRQLAINSYLRISSGVNAQVHSTTGVAVAHAVDENIPYGQPVNSNVPHLNLQAIDTIYNNVAEDLFVKPSLWLRVLSAVVTFSLTEAIPRYIPNYSVVSAIIVFATAFGMETFMPLCTSKNSMNMARDKMLKEVLARLERATTETEFSRTLEGLANVSNELIQGSGCFPYVRGAFSAACGCFFKSSQVPIGGVLSALASDFFIEGNKAAMTDNMENLDQVLNDFPRARFV
ncbi:MAG: hypothetical protein K0S08_1803 [Gammaproteobacteria bacterium]|jgi:hypothetical protein|nr:hypothetical protein [Gammaproteobacteria bacterium]